MSATLNDRLLSNSQKGVLMGLGGEVPFPMSPYSAEILAGYWPSQSATAEIEQTKTDLAQIANKAGSDINAAEQKHSDAVAHSGGNPIAIAAADAQLGEDINRIVTNAQTDVALRSLLS